MFHVLQMTNKVILVICTCYLSSLNRHKFAFHGKRNDEGKHLGQLQLQKQTCQFGEFGLVQISRMILFAISFPQQSMFAQNKYIWLCNCNVSPNPQKKTNSVE